MASKHVYGSMTLGMRSVMSGLMTFVKSYFYLDLFIYTCDLVNEGFWF